MILGILNRHATCNQSASVSRRNARERGEALEAARFPFSPRAVVAHPGMDASDKRAILASGASDACALASLPNRRELPETGARVPLAEILDALRELDGGIRY